MQIVPGWHPMVVHFPLALIVTGALSLSAARVLTAGRHAGTLAIVGTWTLVVGAVTLIFALGSGLAAVIDLEVGEAAHRAISAHVKSAIVTTVLVASAAVWRGAGVAQESRPSVGFLLVLWVGTAALIVTGYRGGQNVYRYGVGVSVESACGTPYTVTGAPTASPVAPEPKGSSEGVTMRAAADQAGEGLAGSFHTAKLAPWVGTAPVVPPKFTLPPVALTKSPMVFGPLSSRPRRP